MESCPGDDPSLSPDSGTMESPSSDPHTMEASDSAEPPADDACAVPPTSDAGVGNSTHTPDSAAAAPAVGDTPPAAEMASSSPVSTSSILNPQLMDADSVRQAILGPLQEEQAGGVTDPDSTARARPKKKKKKKKRPKSAQTSSSSESAQISQPTTSQSEGGSEVTLTESLDAMSLAAADTSVAQSAPEAQMKKKKKKKKADSGSEVAGQDVQVMDCGTEVAGPGKVEGGGETPQVPPEIVRVQEALFKREKVSAQHHQHHHNQHSPHGQRVLSDTQSGKKKPHQKKNVFEPYWPPEKVSEGLKRGTLIQGRVRINPKNYEDAYVPLPDGTADVYISGMANRNRALNGDIVAVMVQDRDSWRVFTEELNHYEKSNMPATPQGPSDEGKADEENDDDKAGPKEESPDVVVEEEEEVELDSTGKPIAGTHVSRPASTASTAASQATPTPQQGHTPSSGARPKENNKGCDTPGSASKQRRYMSVKEARDQGSPAVKRLFAADGCEGREKAAEAGAVNIDKFMQRTGKVVAIIDKNHSRAASGTLRPMQDSSHTFVTFAPTDSRIPRIMIPTSDLPQGFRERPEDFAKVLFIARITEWNEASKMPKGTLARSLGEAGQVEPETEALLIENDVDSSEFSDQVLACLPQEAAWTIPAEELQRRRDLREECVFTIDPSTARDLDDALHCKDLGNGEYEVGVHIADVSYFVKEKTKLDEVANSRATSVYLVQKVIPMLPRLLCEQLCSLNPNQDRLSFSVIWKMTEDGQILEEWFGRTVIRSCVKLSYDHAQGFIEEPHREWTADELPPISNGFTVDDIRSRVLKMNKMAKAMRSARFNSGALRLDQVKIQYTLNPDTGLPNGYFVYQQRDSNKLVEEFMLLANMAVAHKIHTAHKDKALLRRHPPPQSRMIDELKDVCASLGFPMEVNSAKEIQLSLARYTGEDELSKARMQVLVVLCSKPMQNAKYFCCGVLADEKLYRHYALNVPLYTHFTSPIRRYPDILVHRTLAAALGYCEVTDRSSEEIHQIAEHCNEKKMSAKLCSEKSNDLYFSIFVKEAGPLEEMGMVMAVLDKSFDVYVLSLGVVKRVYCEKLPLESFSYHKEGKRPELTMVWQPDDGCPHPVTQKISIFSSVKCVLQSEVELLRWSAIIRRPVEGDASIVK